MTSTRTQALITTLVIGCSANFAISRTALAMFQPALRLEEVPIDRLLKNLRYAEDKCSDNKRKSEIEFRLGRLYAMKFARAQMVPASKADADSAKPEEGNHNGEVWPEYRQFKLEHTELDEQDRDCLRQAMTHYSLSLSFLPDQPQVLLGFGWCLLHAKQTDQAIGIFRKTLTLCEKHDAAADGKTRNLRLGQATENRIAQEAAGYLLTVLNPERDAQEIKNLKAFDKTCYIAPVSPIVVPVTESIAKTQLMKNCVVHFDVDGFGTKTLTYCPSQKAGWLVFDPNHKGLITTGRQLFGNSTFWLFWNNGYEALASLILAQQFE